MVPEPFYIVFAGVNGSGKSTLFKTGLWQTAEMPHRMARVNPDEILRSQGGNWQSTADQIGAGKEALRMIEELFAERHSFNHETTLTGHRALKNIIRARDQGYRVFLFYVGVADEQVAIDRIRHRVKAGGHNIDERTVRRRYHASISHFAQALDWCEEAYVFDNTHAFTCLAVWRKGVLSWWGASRAVGAWLPLAMLGETTWR